MQEQRGKNIYEFFCQFEFHQAQVKVNVLSSGAHLGGVPRRWQILGGFPSGYEVGDILLHAGMFKENLEVNPKFVLDGMEFFHGAIEYECEMVQILVTWWGDALNGTKEVISKDGVVFPGPQDDRPHSSSHLTFL